MLCKPYIQVGGLVAAAIAACTAVRVLSGAELRFSSGNRTVYRTVSHELMPAPPGEAALPDVSATAELTPSISAACPLSEPPHCPAACGPAGWWWGSAEHLIWWRSGQWLPPLVTTSRNVQDAGVLGRPTTTVLFGSERVGDQAEVGGRATIGRWLDGCQCLGIAARFFALDEAEAPFEIDSNDEPIIARPYVALDVANPAGAEESSLIISLDEQVTGNVRARSNSDVLGGDIYLRRLLSRTPCSRLDFLAGYQFARIDGDVAIRSTSRTQDDETATVVDAFDTQNDFRGGQIGLLLETCRADWRVEVLVKVGFGNMEETVAIGGTTTFTDAQGRSSSTNSGLLAQELTNAGVHSQDVFAVAPEAAVNLSYQLNCWLDISLGYSFLYWSSVVQPGDQMDRTVDTRLLIRDGPPVLDPPPQRPAFSFHETDFWLQGLNLGIQCRY